MTQICFIPIGIIHSNYKQPEGVPIQGSISKNSKGWVEVFPKYQAGLKDLDGFSHIFLIFHFHLSEGYSLLAKPFMDDIERGVFSIRAPKRPNQIGLSVVGLEKIIDNKLYISGVDIIDNTPLLDIKPYISKIDSRTNTTDGWIADKLASNHEHLSDDRFSKPNNTAQYHLINPQIKTCSSS